MYDDIMSYRRYGRGQGLGFGKGFGSNLSMYNGWYPRTQGGWMMGQRYPNMRLSPVQGYSSYPQQPSSQYTQQGTFIYPYMQQGKPINYQQPSMQTTMTHMNCVHFRNGFCTLKGVSVDPNGPACQNFTPR